MSSHRSDVMELTPLNNSVPEPLRDFIRAGRARATLLAYKSDCAIFAAWCADRGYQAFPADPMTVALFLTEQAQAGIAAVTISRRLAAIRHAHRAMGIAVPDSPALTAAVSGIRRTLGVRSHGKTPLVVELAKQTLLAIGDSFIDKRDRSLLALGWSGALRRSELVALTVADVEFCPEGLRVTIARSKGDKEGAGQTIAVLAGSTPALCPAAALRAWLMASVPQMFEQSKKPFDFAGLQEPPASNDLRALPIYRRISKSGVIGDALRPAAVNAILKARLKAAGIDPAAFGAHSLRSGVLTSAAANGANIFRMIDLSRHKDVKTVQKYVREADAFKDHPARGLL